MHNKPLTISVITVTYNSAATLADTLNSVRQQDYPHVEHILVDGGSTARKVDISGPTAMW